MARGVVFSEGRTLCARMARSHVCQGKSCRAGGPGARRVGARDKMAPWGHPPVKGKPRLRAWGACPSETRSIRGPVPSGESRKRCAKGVIFSEGRSLCGREDGQDACRGTSWRTRRAGSLREDNPSRVHGGLHPEAISVWSIPAEGRAPHARKYIPGHPYDPTTRTHRMRFSEKNQSQLVSGLASSANHVSRMRPEGERSPRPLNRGRFRYRGSTMGSWLATYSLAVNKRPASASICGGGGGSVRGRVLGIVGPFPGYATSMLGEPVFGDTPLSGPARLSRERIRREPNFPVEPFH